MIEIILNGPPKAQKRARIARHNRMYDPSNKDKKQIWIQIAKYKPKKPITGGITVKLLFVLGRPKHHYRTGKYKHMLKEKFKNVYYVTNKPDADNLAKLILDVLEPNFYLNDSQVCRLQVEKIYGKVPRTEIIIEEI